MMDFSVSSIVEVMLQLYYYTLLARILVSWLPVGRDNAVVRFIYDMTEPVMRPFRGLLPPVGGLDFSPILVFLLFRWAMVAIVSFLRGFGI